MLLDKRWSEWYDGLSKRHHISNADKITSIISKM